MSIKSPNNSSRESTIEEKSKHRIIPYSRLYDNLHINFTQKNTDKRYRKIDSLKTDHVDEVEKDELHISKEQIFRDSNDAYSTFIQNDPNWHRSLSSLKPFCNSFSFTSITNVPTISSSSMSSNSQSEGYMYFFAVGFYFNNHSLYNVLQKKKI
jgi:hypothetical protein